MKGRLGSARVLSFALTAVLLGACPAGESANEDPAAGGGSPPVALKLPVAELSGLTLREGRLLGVGDEAARLVVADLGADGRVARATALRLPMSVDEDSGSELEAVAVDGAGHVLTLSEQSGAIGVYDVAGDAPRLVRTLQLHVPKSHDLGKAWRRDGNARGEGLAVLPSGHLLVAKQKDPPVLIEFGPEGARAQGVPAESAPGPATEGDDKGRIVPLATWEPHGKAAKALESLSDLERGPDGGLWVLSSRPRPRLARVDLPIVPGAKGFRVTRAVDLLAPDDAKAEGLAFLPGGRIVVGLDGPEGRANLLYLTAP